MYHRIKAFLADDSVFYSLLITLVGVTSFGLGRWSVDERPVHTQTPTIEMIQGVVSEMETAVPALDGAEAPSSATTGQYVASKNGSKYHLPWCPGAKQMKEENKVWFASKPAAEAAGYTAAANCPGL